MSSPLKIGSGNKVLDYADLWTSATPDSSLYTNTGGSSFTQARGMIVQTQDGAATVSFRTVLSLKTFYKFTFAASAVVYGAAGASNTTNSATIQITDASSNTVDIAKVSFTTSSANVGAGGGAGIFGLINIIYDGTNINVQHNCQGGGAWATYTTGAQGSATVTLMTNNTNTNVSAWTNVYAQITMVVGSGSTWHGKSSMMAVEQVAYFLDSVLTQ